MALRPWPHKSRVERDFDCLIERIRQRRYPERIPVLVSYWFRTVWCNGYQDREWKGLARLLKKEWLAKLGPLAASVPGTVDLPDWVRQIRRSSHHPSPSPKPLAIPTRQIDSEALIPYLFRLLNEWLPVEVAHLMIDEPVEDSTGAGIPAIVVARAMERLLLREHLSHATLESMLFAGPLSPRIVYPADVEILQDVLLFLLGETHAPAPARLPAELLCVAPGAPLSRAYSQAVASAVLTAGSSGAEELHVPIPPSQAIELVKTDHIQITSAIVTTDGQLWQASKLQRGERDFIVYSPAGRLRIDYSENHARIFLPWTERRAHWSGPVSFPGRVEMFGREWHISHWEQNPEGAMLHLVFADSLPVTAIEPDAKSHLSRSHPAEIDMAWAGLESALAASLARHNLEPVEHLRRMELIPLGRALFGLVESVRTRQSNMDEIETRLIGIRYLSRGVSPVYGPLPWRILPEAVRKIVIADGRYRPLADRFQEVFQGLPKDWSGAAVHRWSSGSLRWLWSKRALWSGSGSPSRAA